MGRRRFGEKQGVFSDNCRLPCTALLFFTTTLGMPTSSKTDEFSEKFQRWGGHIQSKNLCCKIWTFKQGYLTMKTATFEDFVAS